MAALAAMLFCLHAAHSYMTPRSRGLGPRRQRTTRTAPLMLFDKFDAEAVNVLMYAQQETRARPRK